MTIQAAIGHTLIARETIQAMRKDVPVRCHGGDIARRDERFVPLGRPADQCKRLL